MCGRLRGLGEEAEFRPWAPAPFEAWLGGLRGEAQRRRRREWSSATPQARFRAARAAGRWVRPAPRPARAAGTPRPRRARLAAAPTAGVSAQMTRQRHASVATDPSVADKPGAGPPDGPVAAWATGVKPHMALCRKGREHVPEAPLPAVPAPPSAPTAERDAGAARGFGPDARLRRGAGPLAGRLRSRPASGHRGPPPQSFAPSCRACWTEWVEYRREFSDRRRYAAITGGCWMAHRGTRHRGLMVKSSRDFSQLSLISSF